MVYEKYIASEAWSQRRAIYFAAFARRCRRCLTTESIELHHLSYDHMGHEPDSDLMALCTSCHAFAHQIQRLTGHELRFATFLAVTDKGRSARQKVPAPFTPANQRLTQKERRAAPTTGRAGRLSGLPIVIIKST